MDGMFEGCTNLTSINMDGWDCANVTATYDMFKDCISLYSLDLSALNFESITNMMDMFNGCNNLEVLRLGSFSSQANPIRDRMFLNCWALRRIYCDPGTVWQASQSGRMFEDCWSLEGYCPERSFYYDGSYDDITYARVCTPEQDGYFTSNEYMPQLLGDVDGDGTVSIGDLTTLIDYVLSGNPTGINLPNADCDLTGYVDIGDITTLIDYLLNGYWPWPY